MGLEVRFFYYYIECVNYIGITDWRKGNSGIFRKYLHYFKFKKTKRKICFTKKIVISTNNIFNVPTFRSLRGELKCAPDRFQSFNKSLGIDQWVWRKNFEFNDVSFSHYTCWIRILSLKSYSEWLKSN